MHLLTKGTSNVHIFNFIRNISVTKVKAERIRVMQIFNAVFVYITGTYLVA
jgi:hypothetical protein